MRTKPQVREPREGVWVWRQGGGKPSRGRRAEFPWRQLWPVTKSGEMTCCGRLANEQEGVEREGGNRGQRKEGVDQPCEEYCVQKASWVGCGQKLDGIVQNPAREFCSV